MVAQTSPIPVMSKTNLRRDYIPNGKRSKRALGAWAHARYAVTRNLRGDLALICLRRKISLQSFCMFLICHSSESGMIQTNQIWGYHETIRTIASFILRTHIPRRTCPEPSRRMRAVPSHANRRAGADTTTRANHSTIQLSNYPTLQRANHRAITHRRARAN